MKIGLQIPDFTWPGGPARLGADLADVARTADEGGFEFTFDVGANGEKTGQVIDQLGQLAERGFQTAIGASPRCTG